MISPCMAWAGNLELAATLFPLVFAGFFTLLALFLQSVVHLFDDRNL